MASTSRRLSDQEIRSLLLQARAARQAGSFNDVLSFWGGAIGWHGYEADIARARDLYAEGPEAWPPVEAPSPPAVAPVPAARPPAPAPVARPPAPAPVARPA